MSNESCDNQSNLEWFINESPALAEARENGVDLWALWANLQRPVAERLRRHQIALVTFQKLQTLGIIDMDLPPDDSGLSVDKLIEIKEVMNLPSGVEAVRQLEAIKRLEGK